MAILLVVWLAAAPVAARLVDVGFDFPFQADSWDTEAGLPENSVTGITQTPDGYIWVGTFKGLARWNGQEFTIFTTQEVPALPHPGVVSMYTDLEGRMWVSTLEGIACLDKHGWTRWDRSRGWKGDYVRSYAQGSRGELYLTSFNGQVYRVLADRLEALPEPPGHAGRGYLGAVDEDGTLWVIQDGFFGSWDGTVWRAHPEAADLCRRHIGIGPAREGGFWLVLNDSIIKLNRGRVVVQRPLQGAVHRFWRLCEDRSGAVWLGTISEGVDRIDPNGQVSHFDKRNSLPEAGGARVVFEDHQANIWIGQSPGGVTRFKQRRFRFLGSSQGLPQNVVMALAIWRDEVVVGTYGKGVFLFDGHQVRPPPWAPAGGSEPDWLVQALLVDSEQRLWIGTHEGGFYRSDGVRLETVDPDATAGRSVTALFQDRQGRVWIAGEKGVAVGEPSSGAFRRVGWPADLPESFHKFFGEDAAGQVLVGCANRVLRYDAAADRLVDEFALPERVRIACLKRDSANRLWIGSFGGGMFGYWDGRLTRVGLAHAPFAETVSAVVERGEFLWIQSARGLTRVTASNLVAVAEQRRLDLNYHVFDKSDGLLQTDSRAGWQPTASVDGRGRLWLPTMKGVGMLELERIQLRRWSPVPRVERIRFEASGGAESAEAAWRDPVTEVRAPFKTPLEIPPDSRSIEISYGALDYAAPEKIRYEVRLGGFESRWHRVGGRTVAYYHRLPHGYYRFEVRPTSSDGVVGETVAALAFSVVPAFWQTAGFRALAAGGGMAGLALLTWAYACSRRRRRRHEEAQERRLRAVERRLANVLDRTSDVVFFVAPDERVLYMNRVGLRIFGADAGGAVSDLRLPDLVEGEALAALRRGLRADAEAEAAAEGWRCEGTLTSPNRTVTHVSFSTSPQLDAAGCVEFVAVIARDITERKIAEERTRLLTAELESRVRQRTAEWESANVELESFCHSISHDLRAPVRNMSGFLHFLRQSLSEKSIDKAQRSIQVIEDEARRMGTLIDDLLALSRVGRAPLMPESVDMAALVEEVIAPLRQHAGAARIEWCLGPMPVVHADRGLLRLLWGHLISNAVRYSRGVERPRIEIECIAGLKSGPEAVFRVRDNGTGFDMKYASKLFRPFHRLQGDAPRGGADDASSPAPAQGGDNGYGYGSGSGNGLANVARIVQRHGGRVWAEGEPGKGASFYFALPRPASPA